MERNRGADEFVNCVVHRGDRDMMIKPWLFTASLLVPLIYGAAMAAWILWSDTHSGGVHFPADSYDGSEFSSSRHSLPRRPFPAS